VKYFFAFFSLMVSSLLHSQQIDTIVVKHKETMFYHIKHHENNNILIFLHGGINNPIFKDTTHDFGLDFLLENNDSFVANVVRNGFDIVIPVTNSKMNWLANHQYCFDVISGYIDSVNSYKSKYISGFSDGGSGSYKIFYDNLDYFKGLAVFNGYPQHDNFSHSVDYTKTTNKRIAFFATTKDKVIPYEFLLTEYSRQKKSNTNTYFYLKKGEHSFGEYRDKEINLCFDILTAKINCTQKEPIHGFIRDNKVIEFYPFRKKVWKKYRYGKEFYLKNQEQKKALINT